MLHLARRFLPLSLLLLALPVGAQTRTLSGPLARDAVGRFSSRLGSAITSRLAYDVDELGDWTLAIRSVPLNGAEAPREHWPGPAILMGLTHDGKQALFVADLDGDGLQDLAVAPLDGSAAARSLAPTEDAAESFSFVQASADLEHVIYLRSVSLSAPPDFALRSELYTVSLLGAPSPVRLNGVLVAGGSVEGAALSRDGHSVVYRADQDVDDVLELFVVPVDGSAPALELPIPLVPGGDTVAFSFDVDGTHVLYTADQAEDERFELFSIPSDGSGPPSQRSGPLVSGGDVGDRTGGPFGSELRSDFQLSLDGFWVLYMADAEQDERYELFRVAADGSLPVAKLSLSSEQQVTLMGTSHDSTWAVYTAVTTVAGGTTHVYSAPLDASEPSRRLSGPMVPGGDAFVPQISLDSLLVVYGADQDVDERRELYGVPIDGSAAPLRLNPPFQPSGDLETSLANLLPGFWVMADGVMYEADQEEDELVELYFAPFPLGTPVRKLAAGPVRDSFPATGHPADPSSDRVVTFLRGSSLLSVRIEPGAKEIELDALEHTAVVGDVAQFALAPDGTRAQYVAREEDDLALALYSVSTGERRDAVQLHPEGALIDNEIFSPDGRWALYELGEEAPILYSAPADGSGAPRPLYPDRAFDPVFTPDGERLVFRTDPGQRELYVVPLDGSAPALILSDTIPAAPAVIGRPAVSADSRWVAFLTSDSRLYVAPLDDSLPAVQVSADGQLVIDDVQQDGARVFYRTDGTGARKSELFVAPRDGSLAPLRLSGPIAGGGDVLAFDVTPDGARAVYLGEPQVADRQELLTVATDGSTPAVRLHAPLGASADVLEFELAPDGTRVVYRADSAVDERFELFGVPADASQAPVRIGQSPVAGASVLDFRIASDSSCVVFRNVSAASGTVDLFRATLRGGRSQRRIGQAPFAGGSVRSFQLSADASTVAFAADGGAQQLTLLAVPIGGGQKAVELAGPFAGDGSVLDYALSADGSLAAWRADQNETGAVELFAAGVPSAKLRAAR